MTEKDIVLKYPSAVYFFKGIVLRAVGAGIAFVVEKLISDGKLIFVVGDLFKGVAFVVGKAGGFVEEVRAVEFSVVVLNKAQIFLVKIHKEVCHIGVEQGLKVEREGIEVYDLLGIYSEIEKTVLFKGILLVKRRL